MSADLTWTRPLLGTYVTLNESVELCDLPVSLFCQALESAAGLGHLLLVAGVDLIQGALTVDLDGLEAIELSAEDGEALRQALNGLLLGADFIFTLGQSLLQLLSFACGALKKRKQTNI